MTNDLESEIAQILRSPKSFKEVVYELRTLGHHIKTKAVDDEIRKMFRKGKILVKYGNDDVTYVAKG